MTLTLKKNITYFYCLILVFCFLLAFFAPALAADENKTAKPKSIFEQLSQGLRGTGEAAKLSSAENPQTIFTPGIFKIINTLLTFVGIFFLLLMIFSGYLWMTARGDEEQLTNARQIIITSSIGIAIIITARIATEFIIRVILGEAI